MGKRRRENVPCCSNRVPSAPLASWERREDPSAKGRAPHSPHAGRLVWTSTAEASRGGTDIAADGKGVAGEERRWSASPTGEDDGQTELETLRENDMDPFYSNFLQEDLDAVVHGLSPPAAPPTLATTHAAPSRSTHGKKGTKNSSRAERTKWTAQEDEVLVSAWLNVSLDPIVGKDQSSDTYWTRIADYYTTYSKEHMKARSKKALVNRWSLINECVSKYAGYLNQTDGLHQSGSTERDRMAHAGTMFQDIEGKPFAFHHCWVLLADHPKWSSHLSHKKQKTGRHEGSNDIPIEQSSQASSDELERPQGRDAAKAARKRGGTSSMSSVGAYSEQFNKMNESRAAMVEIQKEKAATMLEIQKKKLAMSEEAENERIMNIDLNSCNGLLREYYESRQNEIMTSRRAMNK